MKKLILIFFILPFCVKAQIIVGDTLSGNIIYKNIKDSIIGSMSGNSVTQADFDLDADNIMDVRFKITRSISPGHTSIQQQVFSLNNLEFVLATSPAGYADTVFLNSQINGGLNWGTSAGGLYLYNYWYSGGNYSVYGTFLNPNNYLGFKKISAIDTVYGWILVDGSYLSHNRIKVCSWAYENLCIKSPIVLNITTSSSLICASDSVSLHVTGADTYTWSTGDTNPDIVVSPSATKTYTVEGSSMNGCWAISVITQSVNPVPSLTISATSSTMCTSESVTVSASGADTYTWSTGDSNPDIVVNPGVTTTYTVEGSNTFGCSTNSTMTIMVDPCVGVKKYNFSEVKIFPNPATNILHILDENTFENGTIEISNYLWQTIIKQNYSNTVDISKLPAGIYTLQIVTQEKQSFYSKFIKE